MTIDDKGLRLPNKTTYFMSEGRSVTVGSHEEASPAPKGKKDDNGKLKYHLIPWQVLEGLASVLTFGAKKYAPENWRVLADPEERYEDAMWRHIMEYKKGNRLDKDSKMPHLWHAVTNLAFLIYFEAQSEILEGAQNDQGESVHATIAK